MPSGPAAAASTVEPQTVTFSSSDPPGAVTRRPGQPAAETLIVPGPWLAVSWPLVIVPGPWLAVSWPLVIVPGP